MIVRRIKLCKKKCTFISKINLFKKKMSCLPIKKFNLTAKFYVTERSPTNFRIPEKISFNFILIST